MRIEVYEIMTKLYILNISMYTYIYIYIFIEHIRAEDEQTSLARIQFIYKFELKFNLEFGSFIKRTS